MLEDLYKFTAKFNGKPVAIEQSDAECTISTQLFCDKKEDNESHPSCTIQVPHSKIVTRCGEQWTCPWEACKKCYTFTLELPSGIRNAITTPDPDNGLQRRFTGLNNVVESRAARLEEKTEELMTAIKDLKIQDQPHQVPRKEDTRINASLNKDLMAAVEKIYNTTTTIDHNVTRLDHGVCRLVNDNLQGIIPELQEIHKAVAGLLGCWVPLVCLGPTCLKLTTSSTNFKKPVAVAAGILFLRVSRFSQWRGDVGVSVVDDCDRKSDAEAQF